VTEKQLPRITCLMGEVTCGLSNDLASLLMAYETKDELVLLHFIFDEFVYRDGSWQNFRKL